MTYFVTWSLFSIPMVTYEYKNEWLLCAIQVYLICVFFRPVIIGTALCAFYEFMDEFEDETA